jgi:hypothetical protein
MQAAIRIRTDWVALLAGLAIAAALVATWRVEGGAAPAPARIEIVTAPSEQIAISPDGVTATAQKLVPSLPEDGLRRTLELRNATAEPLDVRLKAIANRADLGQAVELDVRAGARRIYAGTLAGLEPGSEQFPLGPGQSLPLTLAAWIPEGASAADWAGRSVSVSLELQAGGGS